MFDEELETIYHLFQKNYRNDELKKVVDIFETQLTQHVANFENLKANYSNVSFAKMQIKGAISYYISALYCLEEYEKGIKEGEKYLLILPENIGLRNSVIECYKWAGEENRNVKYLKGVLKHIQIQETYLDPESPAYRYNHLVEETTSLIKELEKQPLD